MALKEQSRLNMDGVRTKETYVGRKSGNRINVVAVEQSIITYHYIYPTGKRMTANQVAPRDVFVKKFCRASERNQDHQ